MVSNLFPEGFANVGILLADVTCHQNSIIGQSQRYAQCVVACVHPCSRANKSATTGRAKWTM